MDSEQTISEHATDLLDEAKSVCQLLFRTGQVSKDDEPYRLTMIELIAFLSGVADGNIVTGSPALRNELRKLCASKSFATAKTSTRLRVIFAGATSLGLFSDQKLPSRGIRCCPEGFIIESRGTQEGMNSTVADLPSPV